jgi:hypothetical protein
MSDKMTIRKLKIGDRFKLTEKGMIWIKETVQGMDNDYSYCRSYVEVIDV